MSPKIKGPAKGPRLRLGSRFRFRCSPGVECFTTCCADVTIFLMPYDLLRLKNRLGMTSSEFLARHTHSLSKERQLIPLVVLRMSEKEGRPCPFVTPEGCRVYEDRPWSCRMFPLDMDPEENFSLVADPARCLGLAEENEMRVVEWLEEQGVLEYQRVNNYYAEIIDHPKLRDLEVTSEQVREMIFMATYDLDRFREFVFASQFLDLFDLNEDFIEQIRVDDSELLRLGLDWVKFGLFGQKTLKVRPEVLEAREKGWPLPSRDPGA